MVSPFKKPIDQLDEADLRNGLVEFVEDWVVEYKGPLKWGQNSDIAKSIASFANTHGGWLFLGIEADERNRPNLGALKGIPWESGMSERVYQISASHLSPAPYLLCHPVMLENGNAVVAIQIMESASPPHIHVRTGTIPVRNGNTTEPVRLEDRAELNTLYAKADLNRQAVQELLREHRAGMQLEEYVGGQTRRLFGQKGVDAFGVCLAYPTARLDGLLPYAVSNDFPSCDWPGRRRGTFAAEEEWPRPPCHFTARGAHVLAGRGRGFYVDTFGHIAVCEFSADRGGICNANALEDRLKEFLDAAAALYREAGYWGEVQLEYAFSQGGRPGDRVARLASVLSLGDVDRAGMADEVQRILGVWDQKRPSDD